MATVGYAKVSIFNQRARTEQDRLIAYGCSKLFVEKDSDIAKKKGRTALAKCLKFLSEGDKLVITKIDRLALSARNLNSIVHDLDKSDIHLVVLDQRIDTSVPMGRTFLDMLGTFAEFEVNMRQEYQLADIEKAKSNEMVKLFQEGMSKPKIASVVGVSVASVYSTLQKRHLC